jgi:hypothetical protein
VDIEKLEFYILCFYNICLHVLVVSGSWQICCTTRLMMLSRPSNRQAFSAVLIFSARNVIMESVTTCCNSLRTAFFGVSQLACIFSCISKVKKESSGVKTCYIQENVVITMPSMCSFFKVNGLSTLFWGWGREDDELYMRIQEANMTVSYKNIIHYV